MGHHVFISYSTKDTSQADLVRQVLEMNGISCWIAPRNIPGGSNYAREIPAAIRECQVFVLMLSRNSEASIWVSKELDLAVNCRKVIIPMMLEDFIIGDEFNFLLTGAQRYAAYEQKSEAMELLVRRVRAVAMLGEQNMILPADEYRSEENPSSGETDAPVPNLTVEPQPAEEWKWHGGSYLGRKGIYVFREGDNYRYIWFKYEKEPQPGYRAYEIKSKCVPDMAMRLFNSRHEHMTTGGKCWFSLNMKTQVVKIHFVTKPVSLANEIYEGTIEDAGLNLKCYHTKAKTMKQYTYLLMPFAEDTARKNESVKPEHTGLQRLFKGTPRLRCDGYYRSYESKVPGTTYLRFYEDKRVEEFFFPGSHHFDAVTRVKETDEYAIKQEGTYLTEKDDITLSFPDMENGSTKYVGKIKSEELEMILHMKTVDRYYRMKFDFTEDSFFKDEFN